MEAKQPNEKGTCTAFWLITHDDPPKMRHEIDILEAYSGGGAGCGWSDASFYPTAFASSIWPTGIEIGPAAGTKTFGNLGNLSSGFHKYGVKWETNKVTFYFVGQE